MNKIQIQIADDHKLIRETWSYVLGLDDRLEVVAQSREGGEAIKDAVRVKPDVILMDINMAPVSGLDATRDILQQLPDVKIIGVSMHSQPAYAKQMMKIGAKGYVTKNSSREEMIEAILAVYNGQKFVCDEIKNIISQQILGEEDEAPGISSLSEREIQIIKHIKEGMSSKEIAVILDISIKTVEAHRHNILKKLNLKNTAALINFINNATLPV
ncbi:response regulator transcription factor [Parasegetibacter sp. NRK P23]|uniref:response regulator n=1 Tax=Parasegetibacter sp. NRK P23 TaxID=2942999 RepID=UPI0020442192|nr:response regulator transcription factor [Parasegetibacter sp. NRK P23]MCM5527850.1 response regulator transcription factor [Parasegetibacter sp. NRK P23]